MKREVAAATVAFAVALVVFALSRTRAAEAPEGPARRVISLSPSITETVFAMGAGDRVIGVSKGVTWPPAADEVEEVGGYMDADLERIVGLRPDLIFIQGIHAYVHDQATELGIRVVRMEMDTLAEIEAAAREVGRLLGTPRAGDALAEGIERELDAVRESSRSRPPARTFLHVAHGAGFPRPPFLTTGGGTFLTELLEAAGGRNVYSESRRPYLNVSAESLLERAPEVVMVSVPGARPGPEWAETVRRAWRAILPERPGRKAPRVVFLTLDCAQVPGPRVGEVAREMARLLWTTKKGNRR